MTQAQQTDNEPEISMDQLQADFKDLRARAKETLGPLTSTADLARFIKGDLLPFIENHVAQSAEMDGCIEDMMYRQEDTLQPESASIFAGVIVGGRGMALKVLELLAKGPDGKPTDAATAKAVQEYLVLCQGAEHLLSEITLPTDPDEDEDEGDADDEDGDEDDEDEEEDDETEDEGARA